MRRWSSWLVAAVAAIAPLATTTPAAAGPAAAPVIGGTAVPAGTWRDTAAVLFGGQQGCTGVLIAPTVVLTAGHCADPAEGELPDGVLLGANSLAHPSDGETIDLTKVVMHPGGVYDLAVLVLAEPSTIAPRPLATGWVQADIADGATVALVGYGSIDRDGDVYIDEMQQATSTVTDAGCTSHRGCDARARPLGELGAGGMGIDTCPGDSGGPMYLHTAYGEFLAGITSRGYDDNQFFCSEGGIYVRPDKDELVAWIEAEGGVELPVGRGPKAAAFTVTAGGDKTVTIDADDPRAGRGHGFEIVTGPAHGTATITADGKLTVSAAGDYLGDDVVEVRAIDTDDATRSARGRIHYAVTEDSGGCAAGGGGGLATALVFAPLGLGLLVRRRRSVA